MKYLRHFAAVTCLLVLSGAGLAGDTSRSTQDVLEHHLAAFGSGDVEKILSDYTEDSVIITEGGVLQGKDQIEGLFTALVEEFAKPGMTFSMGVTHISGDIAFITWSAETADNVYGFASDTFIIENGKIKSQTVALAAKAK